MRYTSAYPAVGPAHHRPDDIGYRRPRRHRQHHALRFLPEQRPSQQIDGGALCACPSTASLRPGGWITESGGGGLPYGGPTHDEVSSYASPPAGSLMLPYSHYSPASAPPPLSGRRSPSGFIDTGSLSGTPAGLGLCPGFFSHASAPASSALHTPATAATLGSPPPGLGYTCVWAFPAYTALTVEWPRGSACAEGLGEEGRLYGSRILSHCMLYFERVRPLPPPKIPIVPLLSLRVVKP